MKNNKLNFEDLVKDKQILQAIHNIGIKTQQRYKKKQYH